MENLTMEEIEFLKLAKNVELYGEMYKSIDHREAVKVYGGKKTLELLKSLYEKGVLIRGRTNGRINWKNCQIVVESIVKE